MCIFIDTLYLNGNHCDRVFQYTQIQGKSRNLYKMDEKHAGNTESHDHFLRRVVFQINTESARK